MAPSLWPARQNRRRGHRRRDSDGNQASYPRPSPKKCGDPSRRRADHSLSVPRTAVNKESAEFLTKNTIGKRRSQCGCDLTQLERRGWPGLSLARGSIQEVHCDYSEHLLDGPWPLGCRDQLWIV